jgi:hypothetical protein
VLLESDSLLIQIDEAVLRYGGSGEERGPDLMDGLVGSERNRFNDDGDIGVRGAVEKSDPHQFMANILGNKRLNTYPANASRNASLDLSSAIAELFFGKDDI